MCININIFALLLIVYNIKISECQNIRILKEICLVDMSHECSIPCNAPEKVHAW